jgi:hypothetical protein
MSRRLELVLVVLAIALGCTLGLRACVVPSPPSAMLRQAQAAELRAVLQRQAAERRADSLRTVASRAAARGDSLARVAARLRAQLVPLDTLPTPPVVLEQLPAVRLGWTTLVLATDTLPTPRLVVGALWQTREALTAATAALTAREAELAARVQIDTAQRRAAAHAESAIAALRAQVTALTPRRCTLARLLGPLACPTIGVGPAVILSSTGAVQAGVGVSLQFPLSRSHP